MTLICTEPPASVRAGVQDLYSRGLILSAYRLGEEFAPLPQWGGVEGRVLAGRVLGQLGSPRLGRSLHVRAFREHPEHPRAKYYELFAVLHRRGPLAAMKFQRENPLPADASETIRADWLAFGAGMSAIYRDFESADDLMTQAERLMGDRPWIICERSRLLEAQDRYDDSLATARRALEIKPWYRVAVQRVAHLLQIADRDEQALELLQSAVEHIESADVVWQMAALQDHLELHADALKTIDRLDALCPLRERKYQQGVAWLRSNVAYHAGRLDDAIAYAEQADNEFCTKVAEKLKEQIAAGNTARRVLLDFPFVRQHHMTCGPATLAAIGRFFSKPVEHLTVVDAICYDGTSAYSERNWAHTNGWTAREFVLSWDATKTLIDRGIPFALATVNIPRGHLQAVIGYDPMRGTILCRDPYQYYITEFSFDLLLEYNGAYGPRAMMILPADQAHRLDGLSLPDAEKFDLLHQIEKALAAHDRPAAQSALDSLESAAPDDRFTFHGRRTLAAYDSNPVAQLEAIDALLAKYPKSHPLKLSKAYLLRGLERRDLLMPLLEEECAGKSAHPLFLQFLATQLQRDAGTDRRVRDLLTRSLRKAPTDGASLGSMGHVLWSQRKREEATVLYNLAACIDDKNESAAQTYFNASRYLRQTDLAISKLRRRFDRLGGRSGDPACTLYWALDSLNRTAEALGVLEEARTRRPEDGQLLLFCADALGRRGDMASAMQLLNAAKKKTRPTQWLRSAAKLAQYRGDLAEAADGWRQVLAAEPLADDAKMRVANLIAQTESPDAAAAHLLAVHERFPHNTRIQQLRIDWLAERGPAAAVPAATELVAQQPGNAWARTRLSHLLTETGAGEEAVRQAMAALEIAPRSSYAHNALGVARSRLGRVAEARRAFQRAIHESVDFTAPIYHLVNSFRETDGKRKALRFVHRELVRQVIFGDGLLAYQELAGGVVDRADVLAVLHEAHDARPDLWQSWSALTLFLAGANELDAALAAAREAVDRFPLSPRMRLDLAHVQSLRGDLAGQIETLTECLRLSPSWSAAARRLAAAHQRGGEMDKAIAVLGRATQRDPLDAETHEALARALWKAEQREPAIASMRKAIRLNPASTVAWTDLRSWSDRLGKGEEVVQLARELTKQRAGDAVAWMSLVRALSGPGTMAERLSACDTAIRLSPRNADSHDVKAWLLWQNGRWAEALAACDPPEFNGQPPINLAGRHAWLLWQQGKADDAIREIVNVLASNSQYLWGWERLLEWRATRKDPPQYLADALAMVTAFPHYHAAHVHLAKAQFATGDRAAAKATLNRLLGIAPDNGWALDSLFSAHLEDKEHQEAAAVLERIERHCSKEYTGSRRVFLAAAKKDEPQSAAALSALCGVVGDDAWSIRASVDAMDKAGMVPAASRVLAEAVKTGGTTVAPAIVEVWCERLAKKKKWSAINAVLKRFDDDSPQWRAGVYPFINAMAYARAGLPVRRLVSRHREALRKHTRLWGVVGFALLNRGRRRACIEWLSDWEQRGDAEPWMLINLVNCLRGLGRTEEARKVQLSALSKKADQTHVKHIIWLAFDEVSTGVGDGKYVKALGQSDTANLAGQYPLLLSLIRALQPLCPPDGKLPPRASRQARQAIRTARRRKGDWAPYAEQRAALAAAIRRVRAADPSIVNRVYSATWLAAIPTAGLVAKLGLRNTAKRKSPSLRKR